MSAVMIESFLGLGDEPRTGEAAAAEAATGAVRERGNDIANDIQQQPRIAAEAVSAQVVTPSVLSVGESFDLTLRFFDIHRNPARPPKSRRLSMRLRRPVRILCG